VLAFAASLGFLWLGTVPLTSGLVGYMFGSAHMSMLWGIVFFSHQLGSFLGGWGAGRGGSVTNMSSNVALMGVAGRDCYTAAKGGIAAITRSLAVAYAPQRVRVNAIAPSATMTERVKTLVAGNAALTRLADSHLLGLIEPDDIAGTALYLASDESRAGQSTWSRPARRRCSRAPNRASSSPPFRPRRCATFAIVR
jgi:NAD(P)-dependent dehydrogenase (short-subunit alcohol dehydrogenase family)